MLTQEMQDFSAELNKLIGIQKNSGFQPGWVLYELEKKFDFAKLTAEQWELIADELGYSPGWAYYRHQEYQNS